MDVAPSVLPCSSKEMMTCLVRLLNKNNKDERLPPRKGNCLRNSKAMNKLLYPIAVGFEAALSSGRDVLLAKGCKRAKQNSTQWNCEEKKHNAHRHDHILSRRRWAVDLVWASFAHLWSSNISSASPSADCKDAPGILWWWRHSMGS